MAGDDIPRSGKTDEFRVSKQRDDDITFAFGIDVRAEGRKRPDCAMLLFDFDHNATAAGAHRRTDIGGFDAEPTRHNPDVPVNHRAVLNSNDDGRNGSSSVNSTLDRRQVKARDSSTNDEFEQRRLGLKYRSQRRVTTLLSQVGRVETVWRDHDEGVRHEFRILGERF